MSEQIEIEFANRADELNTICRSTSEPMILIDAPAGFGKTRLLEAVRERHTDGIIIARGKTQLKLQWKCALIDLKSYSGTTAITEIRKEIVRQIDGNVPSGLDALSSDDADLTLQRLLTNYSQVLLMFDSIERSDDNALSWLYKGLLPQLSKAFGDAPELQFKVVVAGRYVEVSTAVLPGLRQYRPSWVKRGYSRLQLSPFTEETVKDILVNMKPDLKKQPAKLQGFQGLVMELSGGHPRTIVDIIAYLESKTWGLSLAFRDAERKQIFMRCVKPAIDDVLSIIADKTLQKDLETLSIFRVFNPKTIEHLVNYEQEGQPELMSATYPEYSLVLFSQLSRTSLIQRKGFGYSDSLVRSLILTRLRIQDPEHYSMLNEIAYEMYKEWVREILESPSHSGQDRVTSVIDYVREAIYHLSQIQDINEARVAGALKNHSKDLENIGFDDPLYRRELIEDMLQDREMESVFKRQHINIERLLDNVFPPKSPMLLIPPLIPPLPLKVFLCYGSEDKARVQELYYRLQSDGFAPWLDVMEILGGQQWEIEIKRAVRASHAVLVCLSPTSSGKEGIIQKEIKLALDVAAEKLTGDIYIIPVRLLNCEIPEELHHLHRIDYFEKDGYTNLLRALRARATKLGL